MKRFQAGWGLVCCTPQDTTCHLSRQINTRYILTGSKWATGFSNDVSKWETNEKRETFEKLTAYDDILPSFLEESRTNP